jgi:hypothetical protein
MPTFGVRGWSWHQDNIVAVEQLDLSLPSSISRRLLLELRRILLMLDIRAR